MFYKIVSDLFELEGWHVFDMFLQGSIKIWAQKVCRFILYTHE